jgi:hypothetical protein
MKYCKSCDKDKEESDFYLNRNKCKTCYKDTVQDYKKTKKGKVVRTYSDMLGRVNGRISKEGGYLGLPILSKEDFYKFSESDYNFNKLFDEWKASGFLENLKPSIDRKEPHKGYVLDNIRWVTLIDNICRNIDDNDYKEPEDDDDIPF